MGEEEESSEEEDPIVAEKSIDKAGKTYIVYSEGQTVSSNVIDHREALIEKALAKEATSATIAHTPLKNNSSKHKNSDDMSKWSSQDAFKPISRNMDPHKIMSSPAVKAVTAVTDGGST